MNVRIIIFLSAFIIGCALAPFASVHAQALPSPNYRFGFSVGDSMLGMNTSTLNTQLDAMAALGVGWLRFDMEWPDIQPVNSSTFNWARMDRLVAAVRAHKIKILAILDYTPRWAESPLCASESEEDVPHCPPTDPAQFASYANAVVKRYSPQGVWAWEIWDEPNNGFFWGPKADCGAYTALLKATYPAIKSAAWDATIITGGLSPASTNGTDMSPADFLACIYKNGGMNYFSAVGDHPYTFPMMPSSDDGGAWNQMFTTAPNLWHIMVANNDLEKKIWITEFGAPTGGPDQKWFVSEAAQSLMVADALSVYSSYSWTGPFFWYTYKDSGTSVNSNENFFGLIRHDGSTKPAYATFKSFIAPGF